MAKGFKGKAQNPMGMMGQLQKLQEQMQQAQEQLANETVTATSGGGAVKIVVTGDQRCTAAQKLPPLFAAISRRPVLSGRMASRAQLA